MRIRKEQISQGSLILISPKYPFVPASSPEKLAPIVPGQPDMENILLQADAVGMLGRLLAHIDSRDKIVPVSGYRSHEEQVLIWEETMEKEGEEFTRKYVAKPGHSEHESGLAIDLAENRDEIDFICPKFPDTGICGEFRRMAPYYGFIERYPAGRESITGIGAEPWHFRYVGRSHALAMSREKLVLEEYLAFLKEETSLTRPYCCREGDSCTEISYIDMWGQDEVILGTSPDIPYQISGTNEGGVVFCRRSRYFPLKPCEIL